VLQERPTRLPQDMKLVMLLQMLAGVLCLNKDFVSLAVDYFLIKNIKYVCYLSCDSTYGKLIQPLCII
jgi:hypothetical protein